MKLAPALEISLDSVESAIAAERGGASRVELCANLPVGGTTPSAGMIATVRKGIRIALHVMIRPRAGDFCYSAHEFELMKRDILMAQQLRADGLVLGILCADGSVDVNRTRELVDLARPVSVTFHRAFDMALNLPAAPAVAPAVAIDQVIESGADRVLTSGGEPTAEQALDALQALVHAARNRIGVIVCGGVREHNVRRIIDATGVHEVHVGHSGVEVAVPSQMRYRNEKLSMGALPGREYDRFVVSEEKVRRIVGALP